MLIYFQFWHMHYHSYRQAVFMLVRGLFGKYVLSHLEKWAGKTDNTFDDKVVEALIKERVIR